MGNQREKEWVEALLFYKQQHEALDSQVKTLTKEKKEKENVLIDLELVNLKNASLLNSEELRRKTTKEKKKVGGGKEGISKEYVVVASIVGDGIRTKEKSGPSCCQEKAGGL